MSMPAILTLGALVGLSQASEAKGERTISVSVEPPEVREHYRAYARSQGRIGASGELACRPFAEQLSLCFKVHQESQARYLTLADLSDWTMSLAEVEAIAKTQAKQKLTAARFESQGVDGVPGVYWTSMEGDGYDALVFLLPSETRKLLGTNPVVAAPEPGVVFLWPPGNPELDTVLAVGVRKMYEASDHPISPLGYRWNGEVWTVWGEAK